MGSINVSRFNIDDNVGILGLIHFVSRLMGWHKR